MTVVRGQEAFMFPSFWVLGRMGPRLLGSLHIAFLGSWVGRVGRAQEAGLPLHVSLFGWAAARKLGSHWVPFIFPFWAPGSDGWAAAKKPGSR